ncbi:MAG: hypothetical protein AAF297_09210 [Planctomycetota bacterium]
MQTGRKRRKWVLIALGSTVGVAALGLLVAPMIGGAMAPGIIADSAGQAIPGRVVVDRVRLGWFGDQRAEGIELIDPEGDSVGTFDATVEKGLLGVLLGGMDLGTVRVSGRAEVVRDDDGTTNLERALVFAQDDNADRGGGEGNGSAEPPSVPSGFNARVELDGITVRYRDGELSRASNGAIGSVTIADVSGRLGVGAGRPVVTNIEGSVRTAAPGADAAAASSETASDAAGRFSIRATADGVVSRDGTIGVVPGDSGAALDGVDLDVSIELAEVATAMLDALGDRGGRLVAAFGPDVSGELTLDGPADEIEAVLTVRTAAVEVDAALELDAVGGRVRSVEPLTLRAEPGRLAALAPEQIARLEREQGLRVLEWPSVTLAVSDLDAAIPVYGRLYGQVFGQSGREAGTRVDLRGSGAVVRLGATPLRATLTPPAGLGDAGEPWEVTSEPLSVLVEARDFAGGIGLTIESSVRIDGDPAGRVAGTLEFTGLLDADGAPRTGALPAMSGSVAATGLALGLVEPLFAGSGIELTRDIGRRLDVTAEARTDAGGVRSVDIDARASGLVASAAIEVTPAGDVVRLGDAGARIEIGSADRIAERLAGGAGVEIVNVQPFNVVVSRFQAPVAALGAGDLRGIAFGAELRPGDTTAWVQSLVTDDRRHVALSDLRVSLDSRGLGDGVRIGLSGLARVDNRPAGELTGDLFAAGVLAQSGASLGVPSRVNGEVRLSEVATEVFQPLVADAGLVLTQDIGPVVDFRISADARSSGGAGETDIVVTLDSEHARARADIRATDDAVRLSGDGLVFEHEGAGRAAARVAGLLDADRETSVDAAGSLRVRVPRLRVPIDRASRAPVLDEVSAEFEAELTAFGMTRAGVGGEPARSLEVSRLVARGEVRPSRGFDSRLDASMRSGDRRFDLAGTLETDSPFDDPLRTVRGGLTLSDAPLSIADVLAPPVAPADGRSVSVAALLTTVLGEAASLELGIKPGLLGPVIDLTANTDRLAFEASAETETGRADGAPPRVSGLDLTGSLGVRPDAFDRVATLAGLARVGPAGSEPLRLDAPVTLRFSGGLEYAGRVRLALDADDLALRGLTAFVDTPSAIGPLTVAVDASASLPLPDTAGLSGDARTRFELGVRSPTEGAVASIDIDAGVPLFESTPRGLLTVRAVASGIDPRFADRVFELDGSAAGALGERAAVEVDGWVRFEDGAPAAARAALTPTSERLTTTAPIELAWADDIVTLAQPVDLSWTLDRDFATRLVTPAPADDGSPRPAPVRVLSDPTWRVRVESLVVPVGDAALAPRIAATVVGDAIRLGMPDGRELVYATTTLSARTDERGDTMDITAEIAGTRGARALFFSGTVNEPMGEDPGLTGRGELLDLATVLVDAFGSADGMLVTVLGDTVSGSIDLNDFPRTDGTLVLEGSSPNAELSFTGRVVDPSGQRKSLIATRTAEATLSSIGVEAGVLMKSFVPAFAEIAKDPDKHAPAIVKVTELRLPFTGKLEDVEAVATVDPGEIGFSVDGGLGSLLSFAGQDTEGNALERFEAVVVTLDDGIATYDELRLPIGEFTFESSGVFDLISQNEQVTVWAPLASIAAEALNIPGVKAGDAINPKAQVPIRRRGPMGEENPWKLDLSGARGNLISPEGLEDVGRGLLEDLLGGG